MTDFRVVNTNIITVDTVVDTGQPVRTFDGGGNNLSNPTFGMVNVRLARKTFADYTPNATGGVAVRGSSNPNPRLVSNNVCQGSLFGESPVNSLGLTDITWVWGQFVDHELVLTESQGSGGQTMNISTDDGGPNETFPGRTISFTRSKFSIIDGVREQPNEISAFMDASNVYGFNTERAYALRLLNGTGKLDTSTADNGEIILPYNTKRLPNAMSTSPVFSLAGDIRANENIALAGMHTIFVREHNRLCDLIVAENPSLTGQDEMVYQRARRIIAGIQQKITYGEFLPALLGGTFSTYPGYNETTNPEIFTEFSTVGYRLGHTMLSENIQIGNNSASLRSLADSFFNPSYIQANGVNDIMLGSSLKRMQEIDHIVVEAVRSFLFEAPTPTSMLDLVAINIQRGRDHGVPGYNAFRTAYGLSPIPSFSALPMPLAVITALQGMYDSVDDIDPWVGLISENHQPGMAVGPLAAAILTDQFQRVRDGDRFWYQNNPSLTPRDRRIIEETSLSSLLSRNTGLTFREDVFHV